MIILLNNSISAGEIKQLEQHHKRMLKDYCGTEEELLKYGQSIIRKMNEASSSKEKR